MSLFVNFMTAPAKSRTVSIHMYLATEKKTGKSGRTPPPQRKKLQENQENKDKNVLRLERLSLPNIVVYNIIREYTY